MQEFKFHYQNFRTRYTGKPVDNFIEVYAGKEFVTKFTVTEMQEMAKAGKIAIVKEENYEAA